MKSRIVCKAIEFATAAHDGQVRKFTGEPYIMHPLKVAEIVEGLEGHTEEMVLAAILHDTIEDTMVTIEEIFAEFGQTVGLMVTHLTKFKGVTRRDYYHSFSIASPAVCEIKMADRLHNLSDIDKGDDDFRRFYHKDTGILLPNIRWANERLALQIDRKIKEIGRTL